MAQWPPINTPLSVSCQDRLCVNSDADETLAEWERRCARKAVA